MRPRPTLTILDGGDVGTLVHARYMRSAALSLAILLAGAVAEAQPRTDARQAPLRGFTTAELARIEPLLARGVVGLVELPHGELLPGIHLVATIDAPAETVRDVLARPAEYPTFMPAVSEVVLHDHHEQLVGFTWRWRTSIFTLGGEAMLALYEPPPAQRARGYRVVVERTEGDLGHGREVWRILPRGDRSLLLLSTRMDLTDANYITRQMSSASQSLSRSINLAMGFAMLARVRMESERRAGSVRSPIEASLTRPDLDLRALEPVLRRGDLLVIETNGVALRQVSVATRLPHQEDRVRQIMLDPVAFTQALIAGSSATIRERTDDGVRFDWAVDIPIVGSGGGMTLRENEDRIIDLDAISGAMDGGHWRFVTQPLGQGATGVLGWASFDVGSANFLLRALCDADASLGPGLSAATEIMMARALRLRLMSR